MVFSIHHSDEAASNRTRHDAGQFEPRSLRTYTPTQAVLARSAGIYHWTPEGKRLFDFTSGVLVANLGHNPIRWMERFFSYMGWPFIAEVNRDDAGPAVNRDDAGPASRKGSSRPSP